MDGLLADVVERHKGGEAVGVFSVCSAHPWVLEAAALQALQVDGFVLVEATSNQVDQDGGYTGMRPVDFRELVHRIADEVGLPRDRVVLGGDHLGPNRWKSLPAEEAMARADVLVEAYVKAGFTKIHLDCSFSCAGDPAPLTDELVAERAARLIRVAEDTANESGTSNSLRYVIGTEVPVPGGAHEALGDLTPTSPAAAQETLEQHRRALGEHGLDDVWSRIMAIVVQPGVEFDHLRVVDYEPDRTVELSRVLDEEPHMVFEAHSTDYQTKEALTSLVEQHWAVLKVGPGLTFALREALFALAAIENEVVGEAEQSRLPEVVETRMLAEPREWEGYYTGTSDEQRLARRYSYSDRMRYYWPDPEVHDAQTRLIKNLTLVTIPEPLISQYLPAQYARMRRGELAPTPQALLVDHVRDVLRDYTAACTPTTRKGQ